MSRNGLLLAGGGVLIIGYCLVIAALFLMQRRLIYFPDRTTPDPAASGVPGVQVGRLHTADGLSLLAWYAPPPRPDGCVIVFLHGNAGNIGDRAQLLLRLAERGFGVMLPEYRGYGGNPGSPSEAGLLRDGQAALARVRALGVPADHIVLWGESLGTGVAVQLAARDTVAAVILQSPYTSLLALARRDFPWVPGLRFLLRDRYDSLAHIPAVRSPILIMVGGDDGVVPAAMGRRLQAAAPAPVRFWEAPGAGHNNLLQFGAVDVAAGFVRHWCEGKHEAADHQKLIEPR